jgi:heterotetrameric sarcosine oxidase gamma subunit
VVEMELLAALPFAPASAQAGDAMVSLAAQRSIANIAAFKGNLASLQTALGTMLPLPGKQLRHGAILNLWAGPESWLAIADNADPNFDLTLAQSCAGLAAITDQSDGRSILQISGPTAREALAKLLPIDLHPSAFPPDATALTLAAHIPIQIWHSTEGFELACFRSYAETLYEALIEASRF